MHINSKLTLIDAESGQKYQESEIRDKTSKFSAKIQEKCRKNDIIFIDIPRSLDTICAIISCLRLSIPFTFCRENRNFPNFRTTLVFDGLQAERIGENDTDFEGICYVITTSGTTGKAKQVAVPADCIRPNIDHFCSLFSVTASDSILFSTSLRFDPSIVELFMAFRTGCTLILTPDAFRSEPFRLQKAIEQYRPTIAQFTATVLEMLPSPDSLLNSTSSLRILLIGGSHFPLKFVKTQRNAENCTRIFNVYGVTEVSCWATIWEMDIGNEQVFIGNPIGGSTLRIADDGELILGGPRQCYVDGVKKDEHATGDRVEQVKGGIIITGRTDRMIKHRGIRICLDALTTEAFRLFPDATSIHFIHHKNRNLVLFVVGPNSSSRTKYTTTMALGDTVFPVLVCHVASLPINSSGKVDEKELEKGLEAMDSTDFGIRDFLEDRLKIDLVDEKILRKSCQELGIKSLFAVEISTFFPVNLQDDVIRTLLDGKTTLGSFLDSFPDDSVDNDSRSHKRAPSSIVPVKIVSRPAKMLWEVNLGQCIDGDVLVVNDSLIVCASHSGVVCAVNPRNGHVIWRTECAVRFEATPILVEDEVLIGSKTSGLHFFSLTTGSQISKILPEGVRATCSFDGHFVYSITEYGIFHVIDPKKKCSISNLKIGKSGGGTSVRPVIGSDGAIYAVLTSGWIARITVDKEYGTSVMTWQRNIGPLFAEPVLFKNQTIIAVNVHGILHSLNTENGEITGNIALESGNCFSAPLIIDDKALIATKSGNLVLVELEKLEILKILNFSTDFLPENSISFVKTPKILGNQDHETPLITLISTNGWILAGRLHINILNLQLEDVKAIRVCEKEIFTTPVFLEDRENQKTTSTVLVAGRDDHLRAWDVEGLG